jgi:hypothetical protein
MADTSVVVCDDLGLQIGRAKASLSPSQAFIVAEALIRGATRAIVQDEADRALVRDVLTDGTHLSTAPNTGQPFTKPVTSNKYEIT